MYSFQWLGVRERRESIFPLLLEHRLLNVQDSISGSKHFYRPSLYLQQIQWHHVHSIGNTYIYHREQDFMEHGVQSVGSGFSLLTSSIVSDYFQSPQRCLHIIMSLGTILNAFKRTQPGSEYVFTNMFSYRSWVSILMKQNLE